MYNLAVEVHNLDEVIAKLGTLPARLFECCKSASLRAGSFTVEEVRKFMETGGRGTWEKPHPLTALLDQRGGLWERRRPERQEAYAQLGKFARFVVSGKSELVIFGFGNFKQKDVKRGKFLQFNKQLQDIARDMQRDRTIKVSDKMRRKMGATRGVLGNVPGKSFFPLSSARTELEVEARPLYGVVNSVSPQIAPLFVKKFDKKFTEVTKDL